MSEADNKGDEEQETVECLECGEIVLKSEYQDEWYRWKPIGSDEFVYVCEECYIGMDEKPMWIGEEKPDGNLRQECVVLAKFQGNDIRATVWKFDDEKRECQVEIHNHEEGNNQIVSYDDIQLLYTFDFYRNEVLVNHKYASYSDYLHRNNLHIPELGVQISDGLIPEHLLNSLKSNLNKLADAPEKDFHPNSDKKVLNLVHPSLYCYVKGVSTLKNGVIEEFNANEQQSSGRFHGRFFMKETNFFGRSSEISQYQWLPTDFFINAEGKPQIQNYINGLTPKEKYEDLYGDLEKVFSCFLPMLETVLKQLYENQSDDESIMSEKKSQLKKQRTIFEKWQMRDRTVQVFVKAANYILQPGQTHEGVWHVEGVSQEHIIATGIYYYEVSDNLQDEGLYFRRGLTEYEEQKIAMNYDDEYPPPYDWSTCQVDLGSVDTKQDRCIVFPNSHQHKLLGLSNKSESDVAVRKMLCFFVVDPEKRIICTADVNDQNWKINKATIALELQKVARKLLGSLFPEEVVSKILQYSKVGFTLEEAKENRLALMRDRKFYKDELNREIEREINLCEH